MKHLIAVCLFLLLLAAMASAQGNGFSFQGRLNDGTNPANGSYDLQFKLYDAVMGGNQIGNMVDRPNTVLANGVFSVTLDFGASAFNNPASIFIEIVVKPNGSPNAYTILGPRQQLTVVPYAVRAMNATNADLATNAVHATNADLAANATNAVNASHSASTDIATFAYDATNATNAVQATTANNALSLGGVSASGYTKLSAPNTGFLQLTGDVVIDGNARQQLTSNGFVKAMAYVQQDGVILRCYNGVTNSSSGNCGFNFARIGPGDYDLDFGFRIDNRFVSVTARNPLLATTHVGVTIRESSANVIEVLTFITNITTIGDDANFMIFIY